MTIDETVRARREAIRAEYLDEEAEAAEVEALARQPILHVPADELMAADAGEHVRAALQPRAGAAPAWYLHFDVDVAGPVEAPGGMTPAPYWPPRERLGLFL